MALGPACSCCRDHGPNCDAPSILRTRRFEPVLGPASTAPPVGCFEWLAASVLTRRPHIHAWTRSFAMTTGRLRRPLPPGVAGESGADQRPASRACRD